jgi:inositol oxygenase
MLKVESPALPEHLLQGKATDDFRNYEDSARDEIVKATYKLNHTRQTVQFVRKMKKGYAQFKRARMTIWQALDRLNEVIDDSDPDNDAAQIFHAFQTAEALRANYPELDWLPLVGLIHDLGKIMVLPGFGELPQWATVGDTFPVGCLHSDRVITPEFFAENPDRAIPEYCSPCGIYAEHCGISNLEMSWGHDEYMYMVCKHNNSTIPDIGLNIIRFHSFYSWHKENAYEHLMCESDFDLRHWVKRFSWCDLYSKDMTTPTLEDVERLTPHYQMLIDKYFPISELEW